MSGTLPDIGVLRANMAKHKPRQPARFLKPLIDAATTRAAVLAPLFERDGQWHMVFVEKRQDLRKHAGDVAFPGGAAQDKSEEPWLTALRECEEETGIAPDTVTQLGPLSVIPTMTGYLVQPFVGVLQADPGPLQTGDPGEVARVFTERVDWFLDPANRWLKVHFWQGWPYPEWRHPSTGARIWGATGMMINELLRIWTDTDVVLEAAQAL